jgi:xanthine dehydrogenase accessory factor
VTDDDDPACAAARGEAPPDTHTDRRKLVLIFRSPMADELFDLAGRTGFDATLVEPDALDDAPIDADTDVVVTDHDRPELGEVLRDALARKPRWVGVMGSVRHVAPHLKALHELGVAEEEIARVHRPIGLNIGSRTPAEIALATIAGLIADRNHRPGGFVF